MENQTNSTTSAQSDSAKNRERKDIERPALRELNLPGYNKPLRVIKEATRVSAEDIFDPGLRAMTLR